MRAVTVTALAAGLLSGCMGEVVDPAASPEMVGDALRRSDRCDVVPDPVAVGALYRVLGAGLRAGEPATVEITDAAGTLQLTATADADGTFFVEATARAVGDATVSIYRSGGSSRAFGECGFTVTAPCTPTTCETAGVTCGVTPDGCGGTLDCGPCDCTPTSCVAEGAECGTIDDGCGGVLDCGGCAAPETCGGAGSPNACGCMPTTCAAAGAECGTIDDGCGGMMDCGSCSTGETCGGGGAPNQCGATACTPTTCAAEGAECGSIPDGCDGTLSCGSCASPETCGGAGVSNQCGCAPTSCLAEGVACGRISDGCGGTLECGGCPTGSMCNAGRCEATCGNGTCDSGEDCSSCATDCGACGAVCGDSVCSAAGGEMCTTCASDCDTTAAVCGNGECQSGETSASCRADCGPGSWPSDWSTWETEVVSLINSHRAAGTDCPSGPKSPVGSLRMNSSLRRAAQLHSWDQSYSGYFSHTSCNGRSPWRRAADQGTSASGETIGAGQSSPTSIVNGWLSSTSGHCDILMSGGYSEIGVGYAQERGRLWTAMFR